MDATFNQISNNWDKIAQQYQNKFMDLTLYNESYDLFCNQISAQNSNIFEIGCGPGNITKYLSAKLPHCNIDAIDSSKEMIQLAQINNPEQHFEVMDCSMINNIKNKYDAIIAGFCMPYLSKEECSKLISDVAGLLHTNGVFYFSTIEGLYQNSKFETSSDGKIQLFVYYHQENYLSEMLHMNAFEILHTLRIDYPSHPDAKDTHLIFICHLKSRL